MPRRTVFWTIAALAVLAAVVQAWVLRWTCDDAFISFRYAQHFVEGHGLVFNLDPAEAPVEGYTNFAWTLLLALGVALGCTDRALEHWSIVWGTLAHAATVLLLARIAWRAGGGRALVPIAACGWAAMHHAASLAPAGLETAMFTLLVTMMLQRTIALRTASDAWVLGLVGVLAAMTRPDGAIPVVIAGTFVLHDAWRARAWRFVAAYAAPFLLVFLPYLLWRHAYYGHWVPNTFFAKSGSDPFVSQGFAYVADFFVCYWHLLLALVVIVVFAARDAARRRAWLAIASFVLSYVAFVLWVGGDFMFARFLLPIVPSLLIAFDLACARCTPTWPQAALAAIAVLGSVLRCEPSGLDNPFNAVSDNRRITFNEVAPGLSLFEAAHLMHPYLRELFSGLPVRIAIAGGHANFAYATHVPVAVECAAGLTDAHIARLPVAVRGKPGHDKPRDPAYLERRRVHFMFENNYKAPGAPWRDVVFTPIGLPVRLVTWDRELMAELRRRDPNIAVQDFEQYLDAYIADLPNKTKDQVRADFAEFRGFWFDHEPDPARRAAFDAFLQ